MPHYDLTAWTDYVRGLVPAEAAVQMSRHLGNCTLCGYVANLLQRAADAGRADRLFEPPAELVRAAEQIFPYAVSGKPSTVAAESTSVWAGLRRIAGSLQWDSLENATPAGVRSQGPDLRHRKYRAGRYAVDLWVDTHPGLDAFTVTGQISDESEPETPMGDMKTLLLAGERPVAGAMTTEFGEFSLRCSFGDDLRLFVAVERTGEYLDVPLNDPEGHLSVLAENGESW